ncbi:MAG: V4R domain-containing protein [Myxococcales bacterium]
MTRLARGYVGINHQTIGSDILAVYRAVHSPDRMFGPELAGRLARVQAEQWYPIALLLEALAALDAKLDAFAMRSAGWQLFKLSHEEATRKAVKNARELLYGFDGLYHAANRGLRIGGWSVLSFEPGRAELEKTTPHHCVLEEGIMEEALRVIGAPSKVEQPKCFRQGADACVFVVTATGANANWGA